jgi:hypothetical protein
MKQQRSSISKFNPVSPKELVSESYQMILADSVEVMEYYYRGKIQELEQSLSRLNILEHAREISGLCKDIVRAKEVLHKIIIKKGGSGKTHFSIK